MLPALPTGMARMSGARPRSSQISKAAVFWPSRRNGLTELTSVTGWSSCSASARTMRSAWSKLPSIATTCAPGHQRLEQLADRDLALRQDDDDLHPGRRAVGRRRGRRVAGRGADDRARAGLDRLGDGDDHAAVLERAGRVLALDLEVQVRAGRAPRPGACAWTSGVKPSPRVSARRRVGDRQERAGSAPRGGVGRDRCSSSRQSSTGYSVASAPSGRIAAKAARTSARAPARSGWRCRPRT